MLIKNLFALLLLISALLVVLAGCAPKGYTPPPAHEEMQRMYEMEWNQDPWR